MDLVLNIFFAFCGAAIGSFLNVCISRLPEGLSIVSPPSRCPRCNHPIRYYDNIPIISYLLLGGRCRDCGEKISIKYPMVEFITALAALVIFWKYGLTLQYLVSFVFVCALIVITFIDLDHQIIPDLITLPGIPLFWLSAVFVMDISWLDALLGLLVGGGSLYAIAVVYELLTKREGMGGGDIKLLAMLGAFLGWQSLLFILLVSSFVGAAVGITIISIKGRDMKYAVPFGPFLSIGAVTYILAGASIMDRYFNLLNF